MKRQIFTSAFTASIITFLCTLTNINDIRASEPTTATDTRFFCGTSNGVPTTMAFTSRGTVPILSWVKKYYPESNEDPFTRCVRVSGIFQTYQQQGILRYITTGVKNGQYVVCAASEVGSPCGRLLFILEPNENPDQEIRRLLNAITRPSSYFHSIPRDGRPSGTSAAGSR
jgi:hypothetical protein